MSQTEPEGEITETLKPKRRFLRFVVRIVVPCLVLWMCWTGASKGYRWFKRYQASRLAVMAENYAKKEKWSEAVMSADTALSLNPLQPQALRFMAEIMAAQGRFNEAMELYGRLFFSGRGTLEDLKLQALNAVRAGYNEPAEYLATLVAERGEPGFPYIVKAEIHSVRGEKAQALEQLRKAVAVSHSNYTSMVLVRFLLANKQVREGDPEVYGLLSKMKKGTDEIVLDALSMGLAANIVPREARLEWLQKIRSHPIKRAKSQLLADTAEVEIDPASKPRVVADLVVRMKEETIANRLQAAQWLLWQGAPSEALGLLSVQEAMSSAATMRSWIDAAAALGHWEEMAKVLATPGNPLPAHMAMIYNARALKMSGHQPEGDALYRAALEKYKDKYEETLAILEYLERSGEYGLFDETLKPLLARPESALETLSRLIPVVQDQRDSVRLRQILALAQAEPSLAQNTAILNDVDYLELVLGRQIDLKKIEARFEVSPEDMPTRFTYALALLKDGKKSQALSLLMKDLVPLGQLTPSQLAILSQALALNGKKQDAIAVGSLIPAARLSAQEIEMLAKSLQ
ncbi:MAG: hypothetical protein EBS96_11690 [Spartobacteria bacterium]|nr:hypothetical protein [Spartobacteria bacterium]